MVVVVGGGGGRGAGAAAMLTIVQPPPQVYLAHVLQMLQSAMQLSVGQAGSEDEDAQVCVCGGGGVAAL